MSSDWEHDFKEYVNELCKKRWKLIDKDDIYEFELDEQPNKKHKNSASGFLTTADGVFRFKIYESNDLISYHLLNLYKIHKVDEKVDSYKIIEMYPTFIAPPGKLILLNIKTNEELSFERIL